MNMGILRTPIHLFAQLIVCTALSACTTPDFGDSEAGLALEDLASGLTPSRLAVQTPRPSRESVSYTMRDKERAADLYLSPQGARGGIVLIPGVVARGRRDARVIAVATTLARLDFTVLVPDMPGLRRSWLRSSDVQDVADAFKWLASCPTLAPPGHVGIAGFSYGAGPTLLAAIQPDIRDKVNFVLAVGGYYSLENLVTYITTGYYRAVRHADTVTPVMDRRLPHPYSEVAFIRSNLHLLDRSADRDFFGDYVAYITGNRVDENEPIPVNLAPDARALYELISNHQPAQVPTLLAKLSVRMRSELQGINPAVHDLSRLRADVILLHGRGDNMIPYTESVALADALPKTRVQLFLIDGLAHVNFRPKAHDVPQLLGAIKALLAKRMERQPQDRL